jgi:hypothetical protein
VFAVMLCTILLYHQLLLLVAGMVLYQCLNEQGKRPHFAMC